MMDMLRLVDHPLVATLGWTLTHFVWQGAVLGLAAFLCLRVVRPAQASTRYVIGVMTLAAMLLAPLATFISTSGYSSSSRRAWATAPSPEVSQAGLVTGAIVASVAENPGVVHRLMPTTRSSAGADTATIAPLWLPVVTAAWMAGVVVLSLRMLGGWVLTLMLARRAVTAVSDQVDAAAREMARRLRLRREFAVLQSAAVLVPTLVGWVRPVVLLPASALTGLSDVQLQAVIAHELAHVRRHDYLVNLLQTGVETLLFYHPAVWWVSSEVRAEREHCCDDLAVEVCGDRLVYVSALAELTSLERRAFALAATDGSLVTRVRRILGRPADARREMPPSWAVLVLLVIVGGGAGTYEMSADAQDVAQVAQAAATPARAIQPALPSIASSDRFADAGQPRWSPWPEPVAPEPPAPPAPPAAPAPPAPLAPSAPAALSAPAAPAPPVLSAPAPPSAPAAPAAPEPPVPPAPSAQSSHGNLVWNNDRERLSVQWTGEFRLSDDERDIGWVAEGARVTIADGWVFTDRVELRGLAGGQIERKFYRSGLERPFDAEAQAFLAASVQRMIQSGMFATERVARLLKQGGPDAVLAEVERLQTDSSYITRVYYSALLKQADLSSAQLTRMIEHTSTEMNSDHEKATVLLQILQARALSEEQRVLVARAAARINSDHEQRRVLQAATDVPTLNAALVMAVLDALQTVNSSHERSQVLRAVAGKGGVTAQTTDRFMTAVTTMSSPHEQRQVLAVVAGQAAVSSSAVAAPVLAAAGTIDSSHEKSQVLLELLAKGAVIDSTAMSFFGAANSIGSSHDRARVLTALVSRPALSETLLTGVLESSKGIASSHERAMLLLHILKTHSVTGATRTLLIDVAEGITSLSDRNQVLATLVRTERR
jgi:beta-lactamase regulating signal transducer with metallopeptidase domain